MSKLRCEQARAMLMAYLDSELDASATLSVAEHLATCAGCRERFEREGRLEQALVATLREERMPDDVRARVLGALPGGVAARPRLLARRAVLTWAAAAIVLVAATLLVVPFGRVDDARPFGWRVAAGHRDAFGPAAGLVPAERVPSLVRAAGLGDLPLPTDTVVNGHPVALVGARREDLGGVPVVHVAYECCGVPASVYLMRRADWEALPDALRPPLVDGQVLDEVHDALDVRFARRGELVVAAVGDGHHLEPASPLL